MTGASLAEFAPTLFILFFIGIFPLINLLGLGVGAGIIALLTHESVSRAADQPNYNSALSAMNQQALDVIGTGFVRFAKLKPVGGYNQCGADLYVQQTNYRKGGVTISVKNTPLTPPIVPSEYVYEYMVKSEYDIGPLVSMSSIPWLNSVPGLGVPARLQFQASRAVEHPEGLDNGQGEIANAKVGNVAVSKFNRSLIYTNPGGVDGNGSTLTGTSGSGWNYPGIYQAIAAAGETVVAENVLYVDAKNFNWTDGGVSAGPGEQVWFDFRADGIASIGSQWGAARGPAGGFPNQWAIDPKFYKLPSGSLIGAMGAVPPAQPFEIGPGLYNWPPTAPGKVMLHYNDNNSNPSWYTDNSGGFIVRIIVTKKG